MPDPVRRPARSDVLAALACAAAALWVQRWARLVVVTPRIDDRAAELLRNLLPAVLDQGRGLRALYRNLDSVAFVDRWTPAHHGFQLVGGSVDGLVQGFGTGPEAHLRLAGLMVESGHRALAREHLGDALGGYSDDARLHLAYGVLLMSDREWRAAIQALTRARELAPGGALAVHAERLIGQATQQMGSRVGR